jgi:hypothetical protein
MNKTIHTKSRFRCTWLLRLFEEKLIFNDKKVKSIRLCD